MKKRIVITGATGFVGKNLINRLRNFQEYEIFACCRDEKKDLPVGTTPVFCDFSMDDFERSLPSGVDILIHLAQSMNYRAFPEKAEDIFKVNVEATFRLAEWGRREKLKHFIFASTGNVYKQQNKLLREDDTCEPAGFYGASKLTAEILLKQYVSYYKITPLRLFGVYGPGQKNMTVPNIIYRVKNEETLTLAQNAGLFFTPIHISDCADMLIKVIGSEFKTAYQVYNISGTETIQLSQLINIASILLKKKPKIKITDESPMYLMGDPSLFNKDFSYYPVVNFEQAITKMILENEA